MQKACKLLGDETNIEPSKYGYYSGVYPFGSEKISKEKKERGVTII